ncbi:cobalamin biosynthesis protein [Microvirga sp. 0TCS3.31]
MIVAGVGFRQGVEADELVALVERALDQAALALNDLNKLATIESLASLPAFMEAARRLDAVVTPVAQAALLATAPQVRTHSARSIAAHGVGSVAEAAALAAAGPHPQLILERIASASATCAIARSETGP